MTSEMSFQFVAAPGADGDAQERPGGKMSRRNLIRIQNLSYGGFGDKSSWEMLTESGPNNLHAPIYVPPTHPETVLKEYAYPKYDVDDVLNEARRMQSAWEYMPAVYGMYKDDKHVYIHMQKLKETVMAKIEKQGAEFLLVDEEKHKFYNIWNSTKLYDSGSMCRVDNMMYDFSNELKYIDAEKANAYVNRQEELLNDREKENMRNCFVKSAANAHLVYLAEKEFVKKEGKINLETMGCIYDITGNRFNAVRPRHFTKEAAVAMMRWFDEGYEDVFNSLRIEGPAMLRSLCDAYEVDVSPDTLSMRTPHLEGFDLTDPQKRRSIVTINLNVPRVPWPER